jgi:hypothetical protein
LGLGTWTWTRLGLRCAWLFLQPALGPHDLSILIIGELSSIGVRWFAGAPCSSRAAFFSSGKVFKAEARPNRPYYSGNGVYPAS